MTYIIVGLVVILIGGIIVNIGRNDLATEKKEEIITKIDKTQKKDSLERTSIAIAATHEREIIEEKASSERNNISDSQLELLTKIHNKLEDKNETELLEFLEKQVKQELGYSYDEVKSILKATTTTSNSLEKIGLAFYNMQDYKQATKYLFDAFQKDHNSLAQYSIFSLLISSIKTNDIYVISRLIEIVDQFEEIQFENLSINVLSTLATHAHLSYQHLTAEKFIKRAIRMEPNNPTTNFIYGFILNGTGKHPEAIEKLKFNLENGQTNLEQSLILLVGSYKALNNFPEAFKFANKGKKNFPNNFQFPYLIGTLYTDLSSTPSKAIPFFDQALKIKSNMQVLMGKGLALLKCERLDEALDNINQAIALNPEEAILYNVRGQIFHKKGNAEEVEINRVKYNSLISRNSIKRLSVDELKN